MGYLCNLCFGGNIVWQLKLTVYIQGLFPVHIPKSKMYWVAATAAAVFILPLTLAYFWRSRKPKAFQIKELARIGIPDESVSYEVVDLNIPRLSGKAMVIMKWLSITVFKYILGPHSIRQSKLDLLRSVDIPDCPTITPLPLETWNPQPVDDRPVEFEKYLKIERRIKSIRSTFKFLSIAELTEAYRSKRITPVDVADNIIHYIKESEERTPQMNIFTQYKVDEIRKLAKASTERYEKNKPLSFLDGVPVGIKEEFDVISYHMRNGTTFWSSEGCESDASIVQKLRDGGAIIIGMTNMHEIGIGVTGNNANRLHGTPRNPYNVNHYTGGSSSGSAAAVASGLCLVALGTDGGGSIRMPSGACGVVGIKASYGRINTAGVVHTAHTVTHAGPICNSVNDAALVYAYIAGPDERDPCSVTQPPVTLHGFDNTNMSGIKIGVDWEFFKHTDSEVFEKCKNALKSLEISGAKIVYLKIPELEEIRVAHTITILVEMASGMMSKFDKYFNELNPDTALSLGVAQQFTGVDYFQAQKQRTRAMVFLEKIFKKVECIITPGLGMKVPEIPKDALKHGEANTMMIGKMMRFMALGNLTGIPGMTFPVGYDSSGLPISLQVMSGWWQEHMMLRVAKACEGCVEHQKPEVYYDILGNK